MKHMMALAIAVTILTTTPMTVEMPDTGIIHHYRHLVSVACHSDSYRTNSHLLITSHPRSIFKNRSFYHSVCSVFIDYFTSEIDIQEPFVLSFSVQCIY